MTFMYFVAGFCLLLVAVFAWMVRVAPMGVKAIGIVYLACFSSLAYLVLIVLGLSTWATVTTILTAWASGWFFPRLLGLLFRDSTQQAPINR